MLARTDSRARALVLLTIISLLATGIGLRLVWWHVLDRDHLTDMALAQLNQEQTIPAERGEILDANGVLLATSVELQSVFAVPPVTRKHDPGRAAELLGPILGLDTATVYATLSGDGEWSWLRRRVSPVVAERVAALDLPGIGMLAEPKRLYPIEGVSPGTTMAAQVIGFVDSDGIGQAGVEFTEDDLLAGDAGVVFAQEDVAGRRIADSVRELRQPTDGSQLTLTIDSGLQHILEARMWDTFEKNNAKGAIGLVMDVQTGAILALASYPSYDANSFATTDPALYKNPAVSRQYEPGSVMKAFTIAAALDAGAITTGDTVVDDNNLRIGKVRIQNADRYDYPYGHGELHPADVLKLSNNVGAAKIGLTLGGSGLYEAFRRFGFGSPTGVDIAGEASGVVWNPAGPNGSGDLTTAQNAFGQGLSVTAVQLVAGYAAIANGGTLVTPHVVAGWTDASGTYHDATPEPAGRIMRQETADTVRSLLVGAIDDGIAQDAKVPGYAIAGKTGTAQIAGPVEKTIVDGYDASGNPIYKKVVVNEYIDGWIDSSFIGVYPASSPRLATLILLHRPATWGRYKMAERPDQVFGDLAPQILDYLAIPPDRPGATVATR
jgi:cell division protein FtsI/penicillin-binding protein 2